MSLNYDDFLNNNKVPITIGSNIGNNKLLIGGIINLITKKEQTKEEVLEEKEIEVILADLSAKVGLHTQEIIDDQKIMTILDFIFAKGRLAIEYNASKPEFNTERSLHSS